jgi:hypothetical protein
MEGASLYNRLKFSESLVRGIARCRATWPLKRHEAANNRQKWNHESGTEAVLEHRTVGNFPQGVWGLFHKECELPCSTLSENLLPKRCCAFGKGLGEL